MPERTPLYEVETQAGAVFMEEAGWQVPAHFGDSAAEYRQARAQAALFDLAHHGKVELVGKDARAFLHNLCTNDIKGLPSGQSCEAFLTTHKAKVIAFVQVHHRGIEDGRDIFWLDAGPGMGARVVEHLERFHISEEVEIADRTATWAQMHLAGPSAEALLGELRKQDRAEPADILRPHDPLGLPGYDIIAGQEHATALWRRLTGAGAAPAGQDAYDILRVEAGTPAYGREIDEDRFAVELGRGARAISYAKGCYLGQEPIVMARDRGHVNRALLGLKLSGKAIVPRGARLMREGKEVGQVTSSVISPRLGPIALAYVLRGFQEPGTTVEVETDGARQTAEVTALPFVSA